MKITEITPPFERKFSIEMTELEMWQLRAVFSALDGGGIASTDSWDEINRAMGVTPDIKDKWYLTAEFDQSITKSQPVRVTQLWIDMEMGDKP